MSIADGHDVKEQIRQAIDIVDLVGSYVTLSRQGAGYKALCPFHDDTRPSLDVNPARQSWRCWVCDIGGDIFSFVMRREGVEFREALEMLADRAGVELRKGPRAEPGSANDRRTLLKAMTWAERQFHECLLHDPVAGPAREYLKGRGITPESWRRFHLGYAPKEHFWLFNRGKKTEFSPEVLQAVGLLRNNEGYYDYFRGRVMFSIRDVQSRPIGAGGRILPQFEDDKTGKYFNSPETRLFSKSEQLYALDLARDSASKKAKSIVVVEGYTDVVMAHQMGVENVVAVMGTALTSKHIRLLKRFTDSIYIVLDGDTAGQRRTNEMLDLFVAEDVDLRIAPLPEGLDPCDFLVQHGADGFRNHLNSSVDALEHRFRTCMAGVDPAREPHRANQALEEILSTVAQAPRVSGDSARQLRVHQMLARLARLFYVDEDDLRRRLAAIQRRSRGAAAQKSAAPTPQPAVQHRLTDLHQWERELMGILIEDPSLGQRALDASLSDRLGSKTARRLFEHLTQTYAASGSDFAVLLTQIDDLDLKSILVALDEDVGKKSQSAQMSAPARLDDLLQHQAIQQARHRQQESGRALEGGQFASNDEEDTLLAEFFSHKAEADKLARHREGDSEPTDG